MRLLSLFLILLFSPFLAYGQSESTCTDGSPEERLACFTRTHCPIVVTEADRADCYRRITLDLLGIQSLAAPSPATIATPPVAIPEPPTSVAATQSSVPGISTSSVATTTTTAEQISEQNRSTSVSASEEADSFGYEWHEEPREKKVAQEINSQIVFLDTLVQGNYLIGLENGQLWLQVSKTRTRLKTGDKIRIVRGSLRSFKLFPEKSPATYVNRLVCHGDNASSLCRLFDDWQQTQN